MRPGKIVVVGILLACSLPPAVSGAAWQQAGRQDPTATPRLTPAALDESLELGRRYLLGAQRPNGSFIYERDAARGGVDLGTRHAVREMGGLWAIAIFHRQDPTAETAGAFHRAMRLQDTFAKHTPAGGRFLCEPDAPIGSTNTLAIHGLALQDFLAADFEMAPALRAKYQRDLAATVKALLSLRMNNGRFHSGYRCRDGRGAGPPEPYSDGEAMLVLVRAAKEAGSDAALRDTVLESAALMYGQYVRSALRADPDSEDTKAFYQWGSMAFYELYTSGWPGTQAYAARTIAMARWMIDVHGVLEKTRNTGYAYEGLALAWELARLTNDRNNQRRIGDAIDRGLSKLMGWQIGGPVGGTAVPAAFRRSEAVRGGIVSRPGDPRLRIDTVQHQMNATLLVRWLLFRPAEDDAAAADGR